MNGNLRLLILYSFAVLFSASGCSKKDDPRWNVILITADALRADHLGCYGYPGIDTKNIDALAESGILFENAYVSMPRTGPSHATILSGLYPDRHGVTQNCLKRKREFHHLGYEAEKNGYETAAFVSSWVLDSRFGFDSGFDHFDDADFDSKDSAKMSHPERLKTLTRRGDKTNEAVLEWLDDNKGGKPDFVWVHYWEPHEPYDAPVSYRDRYLPESKAVPADYLDPERLGSAALPPGENRPEESERWMRQYDGQITYLDKLLGDLFKYVKKNRQKTLIVFTADHGESFEHGQYMLHGDILYNSTLHVPLIVHAPGKLKPERRREIVESIDVAPTIASWLGWSSFESQGDNLLTAPEKNAPQRAFAITRIGMRGHRKKLDWAVMERHENRTHKLMNRDTRTNADRREGKPVSAELALFDLEKDPAETVSIAVDNGNIVERMTVAYEKRFLKKPLDREAMRPKPTKNLPPSVWRITDPSGVTKTTREGKEQYDIKGDASLPKGIRAVSRKDAFTIVTQLKMDTPASKISFSIKTADGSAIRFIGKENQIDVAVTKKNEPVSKKRFTDAPFSDGAYHLLELDIAPSACRIWLNSRSVGAIETRAVLNAPFEIAVTVSQGGAQLLSPRLTDTRDRADDRLSEEDVSRLKALGYIQE